jgi:hypothetical protein
MYLVLLEYIFCVGFDSYFYDNGRKQAKIAKFDFDMSLSHLAHVTLSMIPTLMLMLVTVIICNLSLTGGLPSPSYIAAIKECQDRCFRVFVLSICYFNGYDMIIDHFRCILYQTPILQQRLL